VNLPFCDSLRQLYQRLVPPDFFDQLQQEHPWSNRGIYLPPLVLWLMVRQQLYGNGTLAEGVEQVMLGQPRDLLPQHKRIRDGTVSSNTGAYSQARKRLPLEAVEKVSRRVFDEVLKTSAEEGLASRVYLLDGSGILLSHTKELVDDFPPATNQRGLSHWPVIRVVVAHNLANGAALQPCWGPMFGKKAVSEQSLAEQLMDQLPPQSVVVGDRNFGVFSIAFATQSKGHHVLVRMTKARAQRVWGGSLPTSNGDREVEWVPTRDDRRRHPHFPADARLRGRLIVWHVQRHGQIVVLYLFTTLPLPASEIVELYGRRWNIETDLRSLKQTLHLGQLRSKSTKMVAKELISGVMAYNLVRAVQIAAAQSAGLEPRELSFSQVQIVVNTWLPTLLAATSAEQFHQAFQRMLRSAAQHKLPKRRRRRGYPRAVWGRPQVFPRRKAKTA